MLNHVMYAHSQSEEETWAEGAFGLFGFTEEEGPCEDQTNLSPKECSKYCANALWMWHNAFTMILCVENEECEMFYDCFKFWLFYMWNFFQCPNYMGDIARFSLGNVVSLIIWIHLECPNFMSPTVGVCARMWCVLPIH